MELDLADLQRELQIAVRSAPKPRLQEDFDLDPQYKRPGVQAKKSALRRLVRRIVWRRS